MTRLRRLLASPLGGLALLFLFGIVGYRLIEGWSTLDAVWMVAITLSTIGYGEVHPLSDAGRAFTILLIGASVLWASRFVTQLAQAIADGTLLHHWKLARSRRELDTMRDHHVVIGRGRLGREIVADLRAQGARVVVIDPLPGPPDDPEHLLHLVGDATDDNVLQAAHVDRARAVAVAAPTDAMNVYLVLSVRQLNPRAFITVRVEEEGAAEKARRAGADRVVMPYHLAGNRMAQAMLNPSASAFVDRAEHRHHDDLQFADVLLPEGSPALGSVRHLDLRVRFGLIAVGLIRADDVRPVMPDHDTRIDAGDTLIVVGSRTNVERFSAWATPAARAPRQT